MTLQEIYLKHKKGDWPDLDSTHSYLPVYEKILAPYRNEAKNILEIGLMSGESLAMWAGYFRGDVYGIDCDLKPVGGLADLTEAIAAGYKIFIGDASNPADIEKHFKGIKFDFVREDAGHQTEQQVQIYKTLKPYLSDNCLYIIEDCQDIDKDRQIYEALDPDMQISIIDRREVKGRYDDCLVILNRRKRYALFDKSYEEL